jgi:hypothetical protein
MNNENFQYLSDNIKYMGFGENLKDELEKNMNENKPEFQLSYNAEINKKPFEATLSFRKSESSGMYFFNNYQASVERNNGDKIAQTFYLNKGKGVTSKEAFNLLDGRSVQKEMLTKDGQPYKAWIQLDLESKDKNNNFELKQFHENYGYDLKEAVSKYAVAELNDPDKEKVLLQSLQKGNLQSVILEKDNNTHRMFIEANPQFKTVNLYDGQMKKVNREGMEQYESINNNQTRDVKQVANSEVKKNESRQDITKNSKQKNSLLPKKQNGNSLLPKKTTSVKKGLGV